MMTTDLDQRLHNCSSLLERHTGALNLLRGQLTRLTEEEAKSAQQCDDLRTATRLLEGFSTYRRSTVSNAVAETATGAVQAVFGPGFECLLGDDEKVGSKAGSKVRLRAPNGYVGDVKGGFGFSVRNIVNMAVWTELLYLAQQTHNACPFAVIDEPAPGVHPGSMNLVADVLESLSKLGVQTIVCTNHEQMIPDSCRVVRIVSGKGVVEQ